MPGYTIMPQRGLTDEEKFCLEGCRSYKQYHQMRCGFENGKCIFCQLDRALNEVLYEDEYVMVWTVPEKFARAEIKLHALIVPKRHIRFEADLTDEEALSVHRAKQFVRRELGYKGGLSHVREGDMRLNAGTVPHLHINIFEPDPEAIARKAREQRAAGNTKLVEVRIPVFKDTSDRYENQERARRFATLYGQNFTPKQFDEAVRLGAYTQDGQSQKD